MLRVSIISLFMIVAPMAAGAQNLLINPEFDSDLAPGWTSVAGGFTWTSDDWIGSPTSGSVHGFQTEFGAFILQCVPVSDSTLYSVGAQFRRVAGTGPTAEIHLVFYSSTDCSGGTLGTNVFSGPMGTGWGAVQGSTIAPVGAQGVSVWLLMPFHDWDDEVRIDHVQLVAGLFWDDFESQSPFSWDDVVGNPACTHDICTEGVALSPSCDPCVATICALDPFCCDTAWDGKCTAAVVTACGLSCP